MITTIVIVTEKKSLQNPEIVTIISHTIMSLLASGYEANCMEK